MSEKIYLYPRWIRFWHWLNALVFLVLVLTGISMQYSNPDVPLIDFELSVNLHNISGVVLTALYMIFLGGNLFSANKRHYKLEKEDLNSRLKAQLKYYTKGIFKNEQPPYPIKEDSKFNPLQKVTYVLVMYICMPLILITGWAIMFPEATIDKVFGASGLFLTDIFHIILGFLLSVFMVVHIYFATISHTPGGNFKAMLTGWHE